MKILGTASSGRLGKRLFSDDRKEYARRGSGMFPGIKRVYVNARARNDLG